MALTLQRGGGTDGKILLPSNQEAASRSGMEEPSLRCSVCVSVLQGGLLGLWTLTWLVGTDLLDFLAESGPGHY